MSKPEICRWCKYWDVDGKLHGGRGASGKCHCGKKWQDTVSTDTCSSWEMDCYRTEEDLKELSKRYDIY